MNDYRAGFERLFAASDDPWGFRSRWYERRKRDVLLASLPQRNYPRAFEPGCANGELAAALATRCVHVLASEGVAAAVRLARARVEALPNVEVIQGWVPDDWPAGRFDLIVLSELGYFLTRDALARCIDRARESLGPEGTLLACHWRHPIEHFELDGDTVHAQLAHGLRLHPLVHHQEPDFVLDVWSGSARSVAEHEGLV